MIEELIPFSKLFWDCDFSALDWDEHRDFIIRRILTDGDWNALCWLRAYIGDDALRGWIIQHAARSLSPRQIRYWALVLDIESSLADRWVTETKTLGWEWR